MEKIQYPPGLDILVLYAPEQGQDMQFAALRQGMPEYANPQHVTHPDTLTFTLFTTIVLFWQPHDYEFYSFDLNAYALRLHQNDSYVLSPFNINAINVF